MLQSSSGVPDQVKGLQCPSEYNLTSSRYHLCGKKKVISTFCKMGPPSRLPKFSHFLTVADKG